MTWLPHWDEALDESMTPSVVSKTLGACPPPEFLAQLRESLIHPKPHPNGATKSIKKTSKSLPGIEFLLKNKIEIVICLRTFVLVRDKELL